MPSWGIHFTIANQICNKINLNMNQTEKNSFIFGNIMPDILEGYTVKNINKCYGNSTHYPREMIINNVKYNMPDYKLFKRKFGTCFKNSVILGYYFHLVTDYFFNKFIYTKYIKSANQINKVEVKDINGINKIVDYNEAIKMKQSDFATFDYVYKNKEKIMYPYYDDNILIYTKDLKDFEFCKSDILNTFDYINCINENNLEDFNNVYFISSEKELLLKIKECIDYILNEDKI